MWKLTYNLLSYAFLPFFAIYALLNSKIRRNFLERIYLSTTRGEIRNGVWIHAASIGEAVIAETIINRLRQRIGNDFIITTNTYYTRDMLRRKFKDAVRVFSLPFDLPFSIRHFIDRSRFSALILVETEIWPNLIWIAKTKKIPVIIINGRISDQTVGRYRCLSFFMRHVLSSVDLVLAQSEEHSQRFISLGMAPSKVVATGNLKYYRDIKGLPDITSKDNAVTFGSIKEKELPFLMPAIAELKREFPELHVFVAPRELNLTTVIETQLPQGLTYGRFSALRSAGKTNCDVVIVDTVGDLIHIYARSKVAFVGGSLADYGGQNMLEPLFVGTPVLFGPYVDNFKAIAHDIMERQAGFMVNDTHQLVSEIRRILNSEALRKSLTEAGNLVVATQRGAMENASHLIEEIIWKNSQSS